MLWQLYRITKDPRHLADLVLALWEVETDVRAMGPELEQYFNQTPADPWLRRARGLALLLHGRATEALPHLVAAAAALENDLVGRFALAECRMMLGESDGDEAILGPQPRQRIDAAHWWVLRSRLQEARGRPDDALESLKSALMADPENREAHFRLGQNVQARGNSEEARAHLERAEAIRARQAALKREHERQRRGDFTPEICERLGHLCLEAGMPAEARAWFEQAIRHDPTRQSAQSALAQLTEKADFLPVSIARPVLVSTARAASQSRGPSTEASGRGVAFEDIASRSGLAFTYNSGASGNLFVGDAMGGGVALFDYDDDGWLDVYFCNGCALPVDPQSPPRPNKLFRNRGDGTFEDVTERAAVAGRGYGMGCAVGDYDNDGHIDLFLSGLGQTILYRNRGDGTFEDVTERAGVNSTRWTTAAGFGDLDGDGDLDLFVVTYVDADPRQVPTCRDNAGGLIHCSPGRFEAQLDLLFQNNGDGTFSNVSSASGIEVPNGRGLGLAIADFDGDGRLDLFVANDGSPNFLFRNLGGMKFEEVGIRTGAGCNGEGKATASMGVVAADLDGDGLIDLFHTNFINESSTFHKNVGGGVFTDATLWANLDAPSRAKTGFGAVAIDVDNDGRLDLFVANGHVDDQPWINTPMAQTAQLFFSQESGRFRLARLPNVAYFSRALVGRGVAAGDLDNDGRVDIVVVNRDAPAAVLQNVTEGGHWLGLRLRGTRSGTTPIGTRVTCRAGERTSTHWLTSGTSYLSASDTRIWIGLGTTRTVHRLEVHWPSGTVQGWSGVTADRILDIEEGKDPSPPIARGSEMRTEVHDLGASIENARIR